MQTLLFQACLPTLQNGVENRDKAYCSQIFNVALMSVWDESMMVIKC